MGCGTAGPREFNHQLPDSGTTRSACPSTQQLISLPEPPQEERSCRSGTTNAPSFEISTPPPVDQQRQLQSKEGREGVEEVAPRAVVEEGNGETDDNIPSSAQNMPVAALSANWASSSADYITEDQISRYTPPPIEARHSRCQPVPPSTPSSQTSDTSACTARTREPIRAPPQISVVAIGGVTRMPPLPSRPAEGTKREEADKGRARMQIGIPHMT